MIWGQMQGLTEVLCAGGGMADAGTGGDLLRSADPTGAKPPEKGALGVAIVCTTLALQPHLPSHRRSLRRGV